MRPARVRHELVPDDLDRLDPAVAEDRDRRDAEAENDPSSACPSAASRPPRACRSTLRRASAVSSSSAASLAGSSSRSAGSITRSAPASSVSSCSSGVVNAACAGPTAAEHEDLADPRAEDRGDRLVGRVGRLDLLGGEREHPGHVDRDVPVADDDGPLRRRGRTGGPGSPGGRCTRRRTPSPATSRADPRRECPSAGRPARRRRRRRRRRARVSSSWATSRPTSTLPKKRKPGRCAIRSNARETDLIFGMVGRDAEPDESPRRRQPVEHVHLDGRLLAREQRSRRVEPRRPRADDRHAKGMLGGHASRIMARGCGQPRRNRGSERDEACLRGRRRDRRRRARRRRGRRGSSGPGGRAGCPRPTA